MVVLDKTLTVPENPDPTWGVTKRKHTFKDFNWTIGVGMILMAALIIAFYPPVATRTFVNEKPLAELGYMLTFFSGLPFLVILHCALVRPAEEAYSDARAASGKWVNEVLKPYIEKKYGIKFYNNPLFGWNFPSGEYNGRTIEVRIHGVQQNRDYTFSSDLGHNTYKISKDGVWLEQVIRPEKISFKAMHPVA